MANHQRARRTNGWFYYRCTGCKVEKAAVAVDAGLAPPIVPCPFGCQGGMRITSLPDFEVEAEAELYRPGPAERNLMRSAVPNMYSWINRGGLVLRKPKRRHVRARPEKQSPRATEAN